jgi:Tfp pilus assembly protein PilO
MTPAVIIGYVKAALALAFLTALVTFTWSVRGLYAEKAKQAAVQQALREAQAKIDAEVKLRLHYQGLADTKLEALLKSISNIKVEHRTITNNITREREIHKEFYAQPLPESGYELWKRSRALVTPLAPAASSPP